MGKHMLSAGDLFKAALSHVGYHSFNPDRAGVDGCHDDNYLICICHVDPPSQSRLVVFDRINRLIYTFL